MSNLESGLTTETTTQAQSGYGKVHTTLFRDPLTQKQYPIISAHSPNLIVEHILNHNKVAGYTGIINAGESGTGKTTWTNWLVHQFHLRKPSITIKRFREHDLLNLDKIIKSLTVGVDHCIVLDDASFILDELPEREVNKLAQTLTVIRHRVKADVITIMNIHYSKAIKKFFRSGSFRFLTSISSEEMGSYEDLFGSNSKYKLREFATHYRNMMLKGQFWFTISRWEKKNLSCVTHQPFRIGLASEIDRLHFFVYLKESCAICDPEYEIKKVINSQAFIDSLTRRYPINKVRSVMRYYNWTMNGINSLDANQKSIWHAINDTGRYNEIDWQECQDILDQSVRPRPRSYVRKEFQKDTMNEIEKGQTEEPFDPALDSKDSIEEEEMKKEASDHLVTNDFDQMVDTDKIFTEDNQEGTTEQS